MQSQAERSLISKFIVKDKQERYLGFISKHKTRVKFTNELYHFKDFNWNLFREIPGNENERDSILAKLTEMRNIKTCNVISANGDFDGKQFSAEEAIQNIVGQEAIILIFGNADVVYYEGEPFEGRYVSI